MVSPIAEQTKKEKRQKRIIYSGAIGVFSSAIPYATGGFIRYFRSQKYGEIADIIIDCGHATLIISAAAVATAFTNMALGHFSHPKHLEELSETKTLESKIESESKVEKEKINLEEKVEQFIKAERIVDWYNKTRKSIDIEWKGKNYGGFIQEIVPEYSRDIVFLWKTNYPTDKKFLEFYEVVKKINEERKLGLERKTYFADDNLNLDGWRHFVKREGNKLISLNEEEKVYVENHKNEIDRILLNHPLKGTVKESS